MELTEKQWRILKQFVSSEEVGLNNKRGRPPLNKREVLNAILWVLTTGARWKQIPDRYPQYQTCRNYFYEWSKLGVIQKMVKVLAIDDDHDDDEEMEQVVLDFEENPLLSKKKLSAVIQKIYFKQKKLTTDISRVPITSIRERMPYFTM